MGADESSRHNLHNKLSEVLGEVDAGVLMEHLPPTGWADVATKRDLDFQSQIFQTRLEAAENRLMAAFHHELNVQTRTIVTSTLWANAVAVLSVGGLAFAAARLV